jgi:DNA-binding CsgD family transcriptional regulator
MREQWRGRLSTREFQVLDLLARGLLTKQVAKSLSLSEHTVREYQRRALRKLGVGTRAEAVAHIADTDGRGPDVPNITRRELDVLQRVATGYSNGRIADELGVSVPTIRDTVARLLRKSGTPNRVGLAAWGARAGILPSVPAPELGQERDASFLPAEHSECSPERRRGAGCYGADSA